VNGNYGKLLYLTIFIIISCGTNRITASRENKFVQHESLTVIPDSILLDKTITKIILSPSWIIEGPIAVAAETPGKNNLTKLPDNICKLERLKVLDLCMNNIKELPYCFDQLQNLEELDLSYNLSFDIQNALPIILRLKNLRKINLYGIKTVAENEKEVRDNLNERKIKMILTKADMLKYN